MDVTCALEKNSDKSDEKIPTDERTLDDGLSIDFVLPGGANLNLKLPENMMRASCLLLDQLRQQAGWGEAILTVKNQSENKAEDDLILNEKISQKISIH